ncbi:MAG: MBL fold metallo-hydrolase [Paludibacteraceae bacterium]|nr:MBL fold metallo-hydrolase [Paludibacteraceae bacterium]
MVSSFPSGEDGRGFILLIDPACSNDYEQQELLDYIEQLPITNYKLQIVATHGHLDHLWGAKWATEQWHTPVLMHEADIPMAQAMQDQYNLFGIRRQPSAFSIQPIENYKFEIINHKFEILSTPGHTPGSVCLYFPEEKVLFSGDTLFQMGYGRTDLPGGNYGQLLDSLEHLFTLPSDVRVFPGHGEPTTIGAERRF